jgi:hypothetical protein
MRGIGVSEQETDGDGFDCLRFQLCHGIPDVLMHQRLNHLAA